MDKIPKIIRMVCVITQKEWCKPYGRLHALNKIGNTIEEANKLAKELNYPIDCYKDEIYDIYYLNEFFERPMNQQIPQNLEEMMEMASVQGGAGKFIYIIDGEYNKNSIKYENN